MRSSNLPLSLRLPNKISDNVDDVKKAIFKCVDATYMHFPVLKKAAEYSTSSKGRWGCIYDRKTVIFAFTTHTINPLRFIYFRHLPNYFASQQLCEQ